MPAIRAILQRERRAAGATRSDLEDAFLSFLAERGFPPPAVNLWLQLGDDWIEADCAWPERRVIVELDSWAHHSSRAAFRRDRSRDRRVRLAGWEPVRVTWWDIAEEPERLADDLAELLA